MSNKDDVKEGFTETLTNLQLDYIDLYLASLQCTMCYNSILCTDSRSFCC